MGLSGAAWWEWIPVGIAIAAFWGLVAWMAFRAFVRPARAPATGAAARANLAARMARGEITVDRYLVLLRVLEAEHGKGGPGSAPLTGARRG